MLPKVLQIKVVGEVRGKDSLYSYGPVTTKRRYKLKCVYLLYIKKLNVAFSRYGRIPGATKTPFWKYRSQQLKKYKPLGQTSQKRYRLCLFYYLLQIIF